MWPCFILRRGLSWPFARTRRKFEVSFVLWKRILQFLCRNYRAIVSAKMIKFHVYRKQGKQALDERQMISICIQAKHDHKLLRTDNKYPFLQILLEKLQFRGCFDLEFQHNNNYCKNIKYCNRPAVCKWDCYKEYASRFWWKILFYLMHEKYDFFQV